MQTLLQPVVGVKMSSDLHERLAELHIPYPPGPKRRKRMKKIRQCGLLFIHIPKNAGTSISRTLYDLEIGHETIRYFHNRMWNMRQYPSFAILRDPLQRFLSAYRYARMGGSSDRRVTAGFRQQYMNFRCIDDALDHIGEARRPYDIDHIFRKQKWYLTDRNGRVAVDHLFMMEDMDRIRQFMKKYTPNYIPHANRTQDDLPPLNVDQIYRIRKIYEEDYDLISQVRALQEK